MTPKPKARSSKSAKKSSSKPSSAPKKKSTNKSPKSTPTQHKPTSTLTTTKRKPPHLRYTAAQLKIPTLNGIRPTGVQKLPNKKKGKKFVDDGDGMKTIMAMVMAEKEGDVESRMMRARQLEEVREARRVELERRAEGRREGSEGVKEGIKAGKKKGRKSRKEDVDAAVGRKDRDEGLRKPRKRVSFG